jgi:hypothetical protein
MNIKYNSCSNSIDIDIFEKKKKKKSQKMPGKSQSSLKKYVGRHSNLTTIAFKENENNGED